ncbi:MULTISPECIES: ABC transporter ATP-binding protein [unclassified Geobacillus]|uniref:ABC transporter ATP-binding protein n=1 Tax=unclassified Geobacillus TaxID=2642459 RepID=UPI000BE33819|nr:MULTISPECIES: ABC transporter ATP-binding protein [unclassified Geobacillus]PDM39837.1 multidrug ABC transporter ATP-binding protein [Parageobacillus yumthangensis]PUF88447.1 ABC transporter ATP-binding protein [Geobacillus sp. LYN3]RDV23309.1 ABC transporter ATP-binding protein [Parageobacillus toebii]TXK86310.1 ABC transporter ATP-binding protein [Geobacillus sp. AYS3]
MAIIRRYMQFVRPYKWYIIATMIIGIIKFAIPLLIPLLLKYVVDEIIANTKLPMSVKTERLWWAIAVMLVIFVLIRPIVEYYRQYFAQWTASKVLYDIRNRLFTHMQKLSFTYYSNHRTGEIISRVINDVEQTKDFIITGLMNLWLDMTTIIIALIIMMKMDIKLTLVSISTLPLYAFSVKYFFGRLRQRTRMRSQALAELQAYLHERVQGMPVIKSLAIEEEEQKRFSEQNNNFLTKALMHTSWNAKSFSVVNTVTDIAPIIVIGYAGYQVLLGHITVGTLVAFVGYIDRLYSPLRRLVNSSTTLTQSFASMDRMFEFLDETYDIVDAPNAMDCKEVKGDIVFENVTFAYSKNEPPVLRDISFSVKAGETIALVGMSGGGKSTLVSLIPRFYDVTKGRILLDGIDIRDIRVRSLRDQIGMVFQDSFLFSDSVKENILLGKPSATDEEVIAAAKAANAHDFIMNLPDGYDTKVGERGIKLSGGQKQRIAIARVFLKNPPLLIFDEATSALDLESQHYIQEAMERLAKNRTTFIVAHRLSTITHADRIFLIEDGKIVESGTHDELMARKGQYYHLFTIQQLNYTE